MLRGVTTEQSEDFSFLRKRERMTPLSREETHAPGLNPTVEAAACSRIEPTGVERHRWQIDRSK
jgi:hypothetical protein